jgi:hypothetical protein
VTAWTQPALPQAGLCIVALRNREPVSTSRGDRRIEDRCIKVNRAHCTFGKASNLGRRARDDARVFGDANICFMPLAMLANDLVRAERQVLERLGAWRVRGPDGRLNEWLCGIEPEEVARIALAALSEDGIAFTPCVP